MALARKEREQQAALGLDQAALDEAARQGLALGEFEESEEEGVEVVEEFYPDSDTDGNRGGGAAQAPAPISLRGKLHRKQEALGVRATATGDPGVSHAGSVPKYQRDPDKPLEHHFRLRVRWLQLPLINFETVTRLSPAPK